jgi:hypothetical protein
MYNFLQLHLLRFSQTHILSSAIFSEKLIFSLNCQTNVHINAKQRPLSLDDKILSIGFEKNRRLNPNKKIPKNKKKIRK